MYESMQGGSPREKAALLHSLQLLFLPMCECPLHSLPSSRPPCVTGSALPPHLQNFRASHQDFQPDGALPLSASAIPITDGTQVFSTSQGKVGGAGWGASGRLDAGGGGGREAGRAMCTNSEHSATPALRAAWPRLRWLATTCSLFPFAPHGPDGGLPHAAAAGGERDPGHRGAVPVRYHLQFVAAWARCWGLLSSPSACEAAARRHSQACLALPPHPTAL